VRQEEPSITVAWMRALLRFVSGSARDLTPIVLVIALFQLLVLRQPLPDLGSALVGLGLVLLGLALFVRGLDLGLFPLGESMAHAFARKGSLVWLLAFSFSLGFGTTVAEPALLAIAEEASEVAARAGAVADTDDARERYALGLRLTVALAVGVAIVIGVWRILMGWPIHLMIAGGYLLVVVITAFAPKEIIGIAYDSGGITTSTITVPLVTALGVGLASSIEGRNPVTDGFGLIALASLTPMIFVMLYGIWVVLAGLAAFLLGLELAVFPVGKTMAAQFTTPEFLGVGDGEHPAEPDPRAYFWVYAFAFAIGFSTTVAEPALIAVARKAEELSGGAIHAWGLRIAVALGVAIGISLGAYRIVVGTPLQFFIMGGYVVVILQTLFAPRLIVPLAYDSGGVTTSTVTVPLVAALGLGLAESIPGRSPLIDGFGLIAFASLFPMITVMTYAQISQWWSARSASANAEEPADRLAS
jgi:hypothetical protein